MPSKDPTPEPAAPKSRRADVAREDLERYDDEDQVREALDEGRLRDERPPHHG